MVDPGGGGVALSVACQGGNGRDDTVLGAEKAP